METHQCTVNITSKTISLQWHFLDCKFHLQRDVQGGSCNYIFHTPVRSPLLFHLSSTLLTSFRHFLRPVSLSCPLLRSHIRSPSPSLSRSPSHALSSLTYTRTCTRLNVCSCIYQNGWRVTRCLPVIRMNHRVTEKASGGLGLRISAYSLRSLRRPKSVGAV